MPINAKPINANATLQDEARDREDEARARETALFIQGMAVVANQQMQHMLDMQHMRAIVGPHLQGGVNYPQLQGPELDEDCVEPI